MLPTLFEKALNIDPPWKVQKIVLQQAEMTIDVYIDFPKGSLFPCPKCDNLCNAYDTKEVRLRHLDFFQYRCYGKERLVKRIVSV